MIAPERPIIMQGPNVLAIQRGLKTQTRRIVKPMRGCGMRGKWRINGAEGKGGGYSRNIAATLRGVGVLYGENEMSTHGPWDYDPRDKEIYHRQDGFPCVICDMRLHSGDDAEQLADAHLIAAAPDLLAACKLAVAPLEHLPGCLFLKHRLSPCQCGFWDRSNKAKDQIKAAIAKAERLRLNGQTSGPWSAPRGRR